MNALELFGVAGICRCCGEKFSLDAGGKIVQHDDPRVTGKRVCWGSGLEQALRCERCGTRGIGGLGLIAQLGGSHVNRQRKPASICGKWVR